MAKLRRLASLAVLALPLSLSGCLWQLMPQPRFTYTVLLYYPRPSGESPCERVRVEGLFDWSKIGLILSGAHLPFYKGWEIGENGEPSFTSEPVPYTLNHVGPGGMVDQVVFYLEKTRPTRRPTEEEAFAPLPPDEPPPVFPPTQDKPDGYYSIATLISGDYKHYPTHRLTFTCLEPGGGERPSVRLAYTPKRVWPPLSATFIVAEDPASPTGLRLRSLPDPIEELLLP